MSEEAVGIERTLVDGVDVLGALSPSRASDFMGCPLLYRFRTIDKLPEPFSPIAVRGTVVHKVLEDLFDLPAEDRTPERAAELLVPSWEALLELEPSLAEMFSGDEGQAMAQWMTSCRESLERYFELEDPRRLEPAERELYVETVLDSKLLLRGFVDRLDIAPGGEIRVVDYKGLAVDTPLPTPDGWTTMGDIQVGDVVFGSDGRTIPVTQKSAVHHRPCYRVTFLDGSSVVCDNVHLWTVTTSHRQHQATRTLDTDALAALHRRLVRAGKPKSLWVRTAAPLALPDVVGLPLDPWLLGAWLARGDTSSGTLTIDPDDATDMLAIVKEHWPQDVRPHGAMTACNLPITGELRRAGVLGNKHIPAAYLRSGAEQRVSLVRGLMDTHGWWSNKRHRAGLTTTDDRLANDFIELLRTLGIHSQHFVKPYVDEVQADRTCQVIEFTPRRFNPFSLPRKALAAQIPSTDPQVKLSAQRVIASVDPVESVPTQCIAVDADDSLYLCGHGFVPTHNTGSAPGEWFEAKALFQMKFYALVIWRSRGVVPKLLQLIYLGNSEVLRYEPDEADLLATERKVLALWEAIRLAKETGDFRPNPGAICGWCAHRSLCPEFGGTPPPLPTGEVPDRFEDPEEPLL